MARFASALTRHVPPWALLALMLALTVHVSRAQTVPGTSPAPAAQEVPKDPLGRTTPRGTVLGFLNAARKGDNALAREYLDTNLNGQRAETLAHQLFIVLDTRLPARLTELSDAPEGSRSYLLAPDQDLIGRITGDHDTVDILVTRVQRGKYGPIWLFSSKTLAAIPSLYQEVSESQEATTFDRFLAGTRVGSARALQWLLVLLGVGACYVITAFLNRALTPVVARVWNFFFGRFQPWRRNVLPVPARLLLLALIGRGLLSSLPLSLMVRQFWYNAADLVTIAAIVWILILLNAELEQYVRHRLPRANTAAARSLLHVARRGVDTLAIFGGLLAVLRLFAIDATPALAGLGVGGIAVALAAQTTLQNIVAGASLIFDQAVRVGDVLTVGTVSGTVEHIGLRSTRIRTVDRTVVIIPNGQIANANLETLSARDKFRFQHVVGLRYETTPDQLREVVEGFRRLLREHPVVDPDSVRVRFIRLGPFSLDIDAFAYVRARDWNHFLEVQEGLLFGLTDIVGAAGTGIAFPSQTMYVENVSSPQTQQATRAVGRT